MPSARRFGAPSLSSTEPSSTTTTSSLWPRRSPISGPCRPIPCCAASVVGSCSPHSAPPIKHRDWRGLTESLEIDQASLQPLLYDLEASMPYLFVENLAIQAPLAFGEAEGTPMRVLVVVSGQWRESQ